MFAWFSSKRFVGNFSMLGVDMHSHLLPGLDDGVATLQDAVSFIQQLHELGYQKLITTPHVLSGLYPNSPETILPKLNELKQALQQQNIPVQIEAAAEYMVDADFETYIQSGKPLLTFGENNILIEMSYVSPSTNIEQVIFNLRMKGLQPVLAHPERYNYYHRNFEKYERLKDLGCIFQVNLLSLSGYYGKMVKITAEKLMKNNMIQLAGTDLHHQRHIDALKQLIKVENIYNLLAAAQLKNKMLL